MSTNKHSLKYALHTGARAVMFGVVKEELGRRLDITPKWGDMQICIITCSAKLPLR